MRTCYARTEQKVESTMYKSMPRFVKEFRYRWHISKLTSFKCCLLFWVRTTNEIAIYVSANGMQNLWMSQMCRRKKQKTHSIRMIIGMANRRTRHPTQLWNFFVCIFSEKNNPYESSKLGRTPYTRPRYIRPIDQQQQERKKKRQNGNMCKR